MIVKYNKDTGLMYVHFVTGVANIQMQTSNEDIAKFVAKANKEQIVGYEIEDAAKNISIVLNKLGLSRKQKLAVVMCFIRENKKKTQKEFSTIINVSEGTYKSIERAEHNISFDTLDVILNQFKDEEILHQVF
ncbi:MAG: hypothetical protein CME71_12560 [Halobacteriovorax sp.]|nr:hypothetical protein [Halobacteriovorax sp.]